MSAVELKTSVKPKFDLKELKCLNPDSSTLSGGTVKPATPSGRPMGDLENNRDPQRLDMDEDKTKLTKVDKFSYPVHRKRGRFLSQSRAADLHHNKKRRKANEKIILPTKFLLGGNINDPLNLNSLCDEEVNRALNERTPQSSPIPTPAHRRDVMLMMPRNQFDPLNLNEPDMENEPLSAAKLCAKRHKKRHKNRKKNDPNIENTSAPTTPLIPKESERKKHLAEALKIEIDDDCSSSAVIQSVRKPPQDKPKTPQVPTTLSVSGTPLSTTSGSAANSEVVVDIPKVMPENKIVSPVIPQLSPKNRKRRPTSICEGRSSEPNQVSSKNLNRSESCPGEIKTTYPRKNKRRNSSLRGSGNKKGKSKFHRFIYGNYNRYYGYRNPGELDYRTNAFKPEWFEGKKVLDIGCNVGHLTLFVARELKPEMIFGLDIDGGLISAARKNVRHYLVQNEQNKYPNSCKLSYGPLTTPVKQETKHTVFPHNVSFAQGSYVLESDALLELQKPEYDMILCMSLTKWIHLNWGDQGLKRTFKRMYRQLRPGGKLIFEPQSWSSYEKRKGLTETIYKNFCSIKLKPDKFADYLTSPEVGFSNYEIIDVPFNKSKGFQRPIYLFYKDDDHPMTMNERSRVPNSHIPRDPTPPSRDDAPMDWSESQTSHLSASVSLSSSSKDTTDSVFLIPPSPHHNTVQPHQTTTGSSRQEITEPSSAVCQGTNTHGNTNMKESTSGLSTPLTTLPPPSTLPPPTPPPPSSTSSSPSLGVSSSLAINSLSSSSSVTMETEASTPTAETEPTETTQKSGDI